MGKKSTPAAPDYEGAAERTAAGNLENLKYQTEANRPDVVTPWGTMSWDQGTNADGTPNNAWTQNIKLDPQTQAALNAQMNVQMNQSELASGLQGKVASTMSKDFNNPEIKDYVSSIPGVNTDFSGFQYTGPGVNTNAPQFDQSRADAATKAAFDSASSLLKPQMQQDTKALDEKLRLQGLTPGTEAYNNAYQNLTRTQGETLSNLANKSLLTGNDIATQNFNSSLAGFGAGNEAQGQKYGQSMGGYMTMQDALKSENAAQQQARDQAMQQYQTQYTQDWQKYMQPLNTMNALLTGQQVQNPQFQNLPNNTAQRVEGADYLSAATALGNYNSAMAAQSQGAFGDLAGMAGQLGSAYISKSDARLKSNITRIGTLSSGLPWYEYDIEGRHEEGVMAQEALTKFPEAVLVGSDGFLLVDYSRIH